MDRLVNNRLGRANDGRHAQHGGNQEHARRHRSEIDLPREHRRIEDGAQPGARQQHIGDGEAVGARQRAGVLADLALGVGRDAKRHHHDVALLALDRAGGADEERLLLGEELVVWPG